LKNRYFPENSNSKKVAFANGLLTFLFRSVQAAVYGGPLCFVNRRGGFALHIRQPVRIDVECVGNRGVAQP